MFLVSSSTSQTCGLASDFKAWASTKIIPQSSSIYKLHQYIDDDGLIRVDGRLKKVDLGQYTAHPILMP